MTIDQTGVARTVTSADGTTIALESIGSGPALVLVDGAFCGTRFGPSRVLASELASDFTVTFYDRRGRGGSTDTQPYAVAREIEDLTAVCEAVGGTPYLYGISSGGALALEAVAAGLPVRRLAVYEAPYIYTAADPGRVPIDHEAHLRTLLTAGKRGAMVSYFLVKMVGAPAFVPIMLRLMPKVWKAQTAAANTLPYESRVCDAFVAPVERLARITVPTRVMVGEKAAPNMVRAQDAIAQAVAGSEHRVLKGQTHQVSAPAIAEQVREFFRD